MSVGKRDSYLVLADITVISLKIEATLGRKVYALYSTQPYAALVMIKVFPDLIDKSRIL